MFGSSRGGVRGGQDQFSWEDVKTDKQRENYLGQRGAGPGDGGGRGARGAREAASVGNERPRKRGAGARGAARRGARVRGCKERGGGGAWLGGNEGPRVRGAAGAG